LQLAENNLADPCFQLLIRDVQQPSYNELPGGQGRKGRLSVKSARYVPVARVKIGLFMTTAMAAALVHRHMLRQKVL